MNPVLVTGATGKQGGATLRWLLERGRAVRAMTRRPDSPAGRALSSAGAEVVYGDFDDHESLTRACRGAAAVLSVQSYAEHGADGEVRHGRLLADVAAREMIAHIVYCSVAGVDRDLGVHHFQPKRIIERHIRRLGLPATFLRPVGFMESFSHPFFLPMILTGVLPGPQKPGDRCQWIASSDVGRIAADAISAPDRFVGQELEVAGDELTMEQAASTFADVIGAPVRYLQLAPEEMNERLRAQAETFLKNGGFPVNLPALRRRWPGLLTLREWLIRNGWDRLRTDPAAVRVLL